MRKILYAALLAASMMIPARPVELGKIKPVELLLMRKNAGRIELITDSGDSGAGGTVPQALHDLKESTSGIIYLDTALYLLASEDAQSYIPELRPYLKERIYVLQVDGEVELDKAAEFLAVHKPSLYLRDWENGVVLEEIRQENKKLIFEEKSEKSA